MVTDKDGNVVSTSDDTYDDNGNVIAAVDGDGNGTLSSYDGDQLVATVVTGQEKGTQLFSVLRYLEYG
jgi:YD repeat-containing protein